MQTFRRFLTINADFAYLKIIFADLG